MSGSKMFGNLFQLGSESLFGRLIRLPLRLIPQHATVTVKTGLNKDAKWIVGSSIHSCWLGTFEKEKQDFVSNLVRPGMMVWDIGANAGFYSIAFSRLVGSDGRVYAFEPFAENALNILAHVRLNNLENTFLVQAALGETTSLSGFHIGSHNQVGHLSEHDRSYIVPTYTVDAFLMQYPDARPDLLKIDVEGAEAGLLRGATELLRHSAPKILLALHGVDQSRECVDFLRRMGYEVYHLNGSPVTAALGEREEVYALKGSVVPPVFTP